MSEQETKIETPPAVPEELEVTAEQTDGEPPHTDEPPGDNAEPGDKDLPASAVAPSVDRSGRLAMILAVLAIMVGIGVAVTAFFTWREVDRVLVGRQQDVQDAQSRNSGLETRLQDTARRIDTVQEQVGQNLDRVQRRVEDSLERAERQQREATTRQQQAQENVEQSVARMREQMGRSQDGWRLAEVEYLLRIANQRLQLQRDLDTALAALMAADDQLRGLADPGYLPVREVLAQEITQLKDTPRADISGLALALASLEERVDGLQVAGARYTPAKALHGDVQQSIAASDWREVPAIIWQAIRRLLIIRTHDQAATPKLPPDQQYFLYQNLHLVLESARLALLQVDPDNFRTSLATAQHWLETYFDQDDPATANLRNELFHLAQKDIRPPLPDISASLQLLRERMEMDKADAADSLPATAAPAEMAMPPTGPALPAEPPGGDTAEPAAASGPEATEGAQP